VAPRQLSPERRRRRFRLVVTAVSAVMIMSVFGLVGMHVMLAQNQFRLDRLGTRAAAEQTSYERLRLQVDQLESPQRIVDTAKNKLGMVQPGPVTYLTPSAPVTVPSTPTEKGSSGGGAAAATTVPPTGANGGATPDWASIKPQLVPQP
jgi:cell division protein FtsL